MASHVGNVRRLEAWAQKEESFKKVVLRIDSSPFTERISNAEKKLFLFFSSVCVRRRNTLPQSRLWYCQKKKVRRALTSLDLPLPERRERKEGKRVAAFLALSHKGRDWRWHVCKSMINNASLFPSPPQKTKLLFSPRRKKKRREEEGRKKWKEEDTNNHRKQTFLLKKRHAKFASPSTTSSSLELYFQSSVATFPRGTCLLSIFRLGI